LPAIASALAPAGVYAEGDQSLSAELGWATFSVPGKKVGSMEPPAITPDAGGSVGGVYERSISSDFSLRGELAGAMFSGGNSAKQSSLSYAALGDVGVVFRFDVLKYVPYAFGGVGAMVTSGGPLDDGSELVLAIGGGLDVLASRSRSYGIEGRVASFGGNVTVFTLAFRGTVRWGYF
jgi:hypothetical protein